MADQDFKILITTEADTSGFKSAAESSKELDKEMGVVNVTNKDVKKAMEGTDGALGGVALKGREFHEVCAKLNQVVPGLGTSLKAVSAASEGLLLSLGPLIIGVLAMDVAMEAWSASKEEAKRASEALAAQLDAERAAFRDANAELQEHDKLLGDAAESQNRFKEALSQTETELNAQIEGERGLLVAAGATAAALRQFDLDARQRKIDAQVQTLRDLQADEKQAKKEWTDQDELRKWATTPAEQDKITAKQKEIDARIKSDQSQEQGLEGEIRTGTDVIDIKRRDMQARNILELRDKQTGMSLLQLEQATNKSADQIVNTVKALQDRHLTLEQAFIGLKQQLANSHFNGK